jgi:hypothetical protein
MGYVTELFTGNGLRYRSLRLCVCVPAAEWQCMPLALAPAGSTVQQVASEPPTRSRGGGIYAAFGVLGSSECSRPISGAWKLEIPAESLKIELG